MRTKLTRVALMSLMLILPALRCGALAAASEIDQRVLEARQKSPALSFVVMEAKLFEGDSTTEKSCSTIRMVIKSEDGKLTNVRTKELFLFDKANNQFGGGAAYLPGTYTVVDILCDSHHYRGNLARFTLQSGQSVNLGCLVVQFRGSRPHPFVYPTYSGQARVVDLSSNAVASLSHRMPVSFGQTVKRPMTPLLTAASAKRAQ
jgi:hypothetical protein